MFVRVVEAEEEILAQLHLIQRCMKKRKSERKKKKTPATFALHW